MVKKFRVSPLINSK